jgi:hypothetical protein
MSQNINDMIATMKGMARPNRFEVIITWPGFVGTPNVRDKFMVEGAQIPASNMGTVNVPYMGRQIPIPGDRTFEPWTITVRNDLSFSHRNHFEKWLDGMNAHQANIQQTSSYKDFVTTIDVIQYDRDDTILKTYKLNNAFPSNVSAIELNYGTNDTYETFTVQFTYSDWESASTPTT